MILRIPLFVIVTALAASVMQGRCGEDSQVGAESVGAGTTAAKPAEHNVAVNVADEAVATQATNEAAPSAPPPPRDQAKPAQKKGRPTWPPPSDLIS